MSLQPQDLLGHYRLVEILDEGGISVVWKAEDTKLGRSVALTKIARKHPWFP